MCLRQLFPEFGDEAARIDVQCLARDLWCAGVTTPCVDGVVAGCRGWHEVGIRIVAAPLNDARVGCTAGICLAARQIGADGADHHAVFGAAEHGGVHRHAGRHASLERRVHRGDEGLGDRSVVSSVPTRWQ